MCFFILSKTFLFQFALLIFFQLAFLIDFFDLEVRFFGTAIEKKLTIL